ncbi:glycosyltransferase family 2 protein [Iodobacter sp. LRB]|uniref:glycosyltransferase family 2 protein n=1 Tax=unclassified Iodobacter TaxID=235634 RepID=UPI000C0D99A3|nr:glycosyltransferase family 2 protein [Iodobacter sp. BJB302]PHV03480.1 glycosyl transferase family 2 [Iodobacter sp. BJB302]
MKNNFVYGVVITYNPDVDLLMQQLESSIFQLDYIFIIDNGSSNSHLIGSSINRFDSLNKIEFIKLTQNVGLAAAQNIGINKAKEKHASHIVLFDQDSLLENNFINGLLECEKTLLAQGVAVAAIGPSFYDPTTGIDYPATVYRGPFIKRVSFEKEDYLEATFIIASGCMIRMDVLDKIGLMCEELFVDYIDVEWCLRAKSMGLSVFITKNARMAHTVGDKRISVLGRTISVHSSIRRYYLIRNSFMMLRKNYVPLGYKIRELIFNFIRFFIGLLQTSEKMTFIQYWYKGLVDGILGRFGPFNK